MSLVAQGLRGFAGLGTVWMCAWGYAAWATPTDLSSMVLLGVPATVAVSAGYCVAFIYAYRKFYGIPLSEEWLQLQWRKLLPPVLFGVLASMALMWFSSGGEGNEAVPADARQIGLAMGWMLMGPTALSLPIGYGFGVWASPDGGVGPQD